LSEEHETPRIEGGVAEILNSRELVINRGANHGVTEGMYFAVMSSDKRLTNIKDPDTGQVLGSIPRETVRVRVEQVLDNMSVAKTYDSYTTGNPFAAINALYGRGSQQRTYYRTLKKSREYSSAGYENLSLSESAVQIGDRVVELPVGSAETSDEAAE
jgi:hypothetical protein